MAREKFTVDDIHAIRKETAEQYAAMSKEEADKDFQRHLENAMKTMEDLRNQKCEPA